MLKKILLITSSLLYASDTNALDYLNSLRQSAGLATLQENSQLSIAAYNHSNYMNLNQVVGHIEIEGNSGFTGIKPKDRVLYSGYLTSYVMENVSWGTNTYQSSIDSLMSAIYHRFTFLNLTVNQVGFGKVNTFYTYELGNSYLNQLCKNGSQTIQGSYYLICKDQNIKISKEDYTQALNTPKAQAPAVILWPPQNAQNIPPVFFEETPDPLPYHSVSGYPISVEFNDYFFSTPPTLLSLSLKDVQNNQRATIILMDKYNDPNEKLNDFQYALFPEKRLEWGSTYYATLHYNDNNGEKTINWCFATTALTSDKFYRIENNKNITLRIIPNKTYSIYIVPTDSNDILGKITYDSRINVEFIDNNTIEVKSQAQIGTKLQVSAENGQVITFEISNNDNASQPKHDICIAENTTNNTQNNDTQSNSTENTKSIQINNLTLQSNETIQKQNNNTYFLSKDIKVILKSSTLVIYKNNIVLFKDIPLNGTLVKKENGFIKIETNLPTQWIY